MNWFLAKRRPSNKWVDFAFGFFEDQQSLWHGGKERKFWEAKMDWEVGHGWLVGEMVGWLFSPTLESFVRFQKQKPEEIFQFNS